MTPSGFAAQKRLYIKSSKYKPFHVTRNVSISQGINILEKQILNEKSALVTYEQVRFITATKYNIYIYTFKVPVDIK